MKKYRLLLYEQMSKRMRGKLLFLAIVLFVLAMADLLWRPFMGDAWFLLWLAWLLVVLWWGYYAFAVRRAGLIVYDNYLVLQGPLRAVKISYGRVHSITSTHMSQHYDLNKLKGRDKALAAPLYQYTCAFIEMRSYPKELKEKRKQFARLLFSPRRPGLLLVVDDWMKLSQDVDTRRVRWHDARRGKTKEDNRSLAAKILDY
jgi:hypothetical protein